MSECKRKAISSEARPFVPGNFGQTPTYATRTPNPYANNAYQATTSYAPNNGSLPYPNHTVGESYGDAQGSVGYSSGNYSQQYPALGANTDASTTSSALDPGAASYGKTSGYDQGRSWAAQVSASASTDTSSFMKPAESPTLPNSDTSFLHPADEPTGEQQAYYEQQYYHQHHAGHEHTSHHQQHDSSARDYGYSQRHLQHPHQQQDSHHSHQFTSIMKPASPTTPPNETSYPSILRRADSPEGSSFLKKADSPGAPQSPRQEYEPWRGGQGYAAQSPHGQQQGYTRPPQSPNGQQNREYDFCDPYGYGNKNSNYNGHGHGSGSTDNGSPRARRHEQEQEDDGPTDDQYEQLMFASMEAKAKEAVVSENVGRYGTMAEFRAKLLAAKGKK